MAILPGLESGSFSKGREGIILTDPNALIERQRSSFPNLVTLLQVQRRVGGEGHPVYTGAGVFCPGSVLILVGSLVIAFGHIPSP